MTLLSTADTYSCEFLRSALLNGFVPHIVGFDPSSIATGKAGESYNWGLGKPLMWLQPALEALAAAAGAHTLVMLADAHDTLLLAPAATVAARFRFLQARRPGLRVLVSAERSCFPISDEDCARFPEPASAVGAPCGSPYRNLNSGALLGEARDVLAMLADVSREYPEGLEASRTNDQAALQYAFLNSTRRARLGLGLDYSNQLFMAMHMSEQEVLPLAMAEAPWRLCNSATGGCPALVHFNGGSKGQQLPLDAQLLTTRLTLDVPGSGDAAAEALVHSLGNYVVGGLQMSVREFCCSSNWTTTMREGFPAATRPHEEHHGRPPWLMCG